MFSKHYQGELAFIRAAAKAYAEANPSTAGLLAERGGDPDVERLLEGFAFLAARVRGRVDDAVPEVIHDLAEILLPRYLRSVPACTIVEMTPAPGALRSGRRVAAGSEISSVPVDGTGCRFSTTTDLDLLPVSVEDVRVDSSVGAMPVLRVKLQSARQALADVFKPEGLRLLLHGELPLASTLLLWLARHLRGVRVCTDHGAVDLPSSAMRLVGLDPEFPLLPCPRLTPQGCRTLQEYFTLPQKLLFFQVRELHRATGIAAERFDLAFQFERPPALPAGVGKDTIRTNCVPAINLFRARGEPVAFKTRSEEHLVRASGFSPLEMEIDAVTSVVGVPRGPGRQVSYEPFAGVRPGKAEGHTRHYRLRRELSPRDGGLDTYISLPRSLEPGEEFQPETLTFDAVATNRSLPERLGLGDVSVPTESSPAMVSFRNIVPVSHPVRPPLGTELHWRLVAHLAANRASIASADGLRALLGLHNLQVLSDQQSGRANALRIESVRGVTSALSHRIIKGAPARGARYVVEVGEAGFAGPGDAFLFGCALCDLLASQASHVSFVEFVLRMTPSLREYTWPPRDGQKALF
jgi:type VI secretion system protein ImpG